MNSRDEIDQVLSSEPVVVPSPDFAARVMRQVRAEAATPPPLEFPWHRFLPGMVSAFGLCLATFMVIGWIRGAESAPSATVDAILATLESSRGINLAIATTATVGSFMASWIVVRWASRGSHAGGY